MGDVITDRKSEIICRNRTRPVLYSYRWNLSLTWLHIPVQVTRAMRFSTFRQQQPIQLFQHACQPFQLIDQLKGQDLGLGWWWQLAFFAAPCFSRFQHCMTNPAFLVASLSPALITCTQPPVLYFARALTGRQIQLHSIGFVNSYVLVWMSGASSIAERCRAHVAYVTTHELFAKLTYSQRRWMYQ